MSVADAGQDAAAAAADGDADSAATTATTTAMIGLGNEPPKSYLLFAPIWEKWVDRAGTSANDEEAREGVGPWEKGVQTGKDALDIENVLKNEGQRDAVRIFSFFLFIHPLLHPFFYL